VSELETQEPTTEPTPAVRIDVAALEQLQVVGMRGDGSEPLAICGLVTCGQFTCQGTCRFTD
jgi:hypothetical protein